MNKFNIYSAALVILLSICLAVSLFYNYKQYKDAYDNVPSVISETIIVRDTVVTYHQTPPIIEKQVGEKSYSVAVNGAHEPVEADTSCVGDTLVTFPVVQRIYEDSTYTAYVSGVDPMLDSIRIRSPTIENFVTTTKVKTETKYRRFAIGLTVGYGYGFQCRQLEPFVGIGVTWNFIK